MQQATSAAYRLCSKSRRARQSYGVGFENRSWLPFNGELRDMVRTLLGLGGRKIVLDLSGVRRIDAAGIGELVRAYNTTIAANGAFRITNTNPWVREMLERAGLFDRLNASPEDDGRGSERATRQGSQLSLLVSHRLPVDDDDREVVVGRLP